MRKCLTSEFFNKFFLRKYVKATLMNHRCARLRTPTLHFEVKPGSSNRLHASSRFYLGYGKILHFATSVVPLPSGHVEYMRLKYLHRLADTNKTTNYTTHTLQPRANWGGRGKCQLAAEERIAIASWRHSLVSVRASIVSLAFPASSAVDLTFEPPAFQQRHSNR